MATTVPNFARGTLVPVTFMFTELTPRWLTAPTTAALLGLMCFAISLFSILTIEETYGKDLDYLEMRLVDDGGEQSRRDQETAKEVFEVGDRQKE